ncbi:MAG: signal peptidase II [Fusicatenibacter sp.]|nr:signal peptidase II [Fusicatenibacter sp.]
MRSKWNANRKAAVVSLAATILLFLADQYTKVLAVRYLKDQPSRVLIPGVLELKYLENRGAAFGILQNQYWLFGVLTIFYLAVVLYIFWKLPKTRYYAPVMGILIMLTAGALGNFYDRFTNHYVVDFIYFSLINFPIFNVADIFVVLSVLLFVILYLFYYREEDFSFLFPEKKHEK